MRILFDARGVRAQSDGLSNYVRHLLSWLLRVDAVNEYLIIASPAVNELLDADGVSARPNVRLAVTTCPFMGPRQHAYLPWLIRRLPRADLYHYPHFDLPVLAHPKSVVTIHDLNHVNLDTYFSSGKRIKRFYSTRTTALSIKRACRIIAVSEATKIQLLHQFPGLDPKKIAVTYEGPGKAFTGSPDPAQVEAFRSRHGLGTGRYLLYVGTDRAHKNLPRLLEAYARVRLRMASAPTLLLVGPLRSGGEVSRAIAQWKLEPWVQRIGYLADEELPLAYQVAEAFVFCSLAEGFGIPLVEAMVSGVPIVTSNLSAMAEVAQDAAVLVDPYTVESITDGLCAVLASSALRQALVAKGAARVQQFRWERTAQQTLDIYRAVVERGAPGQRLISALRPEPELEPA